MRCPSCSLRSTLGIQGIHWTPKSVNITDIRLFGSLGVVGREPRPPNGSTNGSPAGLGLGSYSIGGALSLGRLSDKRIFVTPLKSFGGLGLRKSGNSYRTLKSMEFLDTLSFSKGLVALAPPLFWEAFICRWPTCNFSEFWALERDDRGPCSGLTGANVSRRFLTHDGLRWGRSSF